MRRRSAFLVGLIALAAATTARAAEPIDLKVLYAGDPKSERARDWTSFLEGHFARVGQGDYATLKEADAEGYDVVILDWSDWIPRRDEKAMTLLAPDLSRDYARPTILIGGGTLGVGRALDLKLDDLCVCLNDAAHGMVTAHEVFHQPYAIDLTTEGRPTPIYYRGTPGGDRLGPTIRVWKVLTKAWSPEEGIKPTIGHGMVSDPFGFTDFASWQCQHSCPMRCLS